MKTLGAGLSVLSSLLVVAFVAVALYRPEADSALSPPTRPEMATDRSEPPSPAAAPRVVVEPLRPSVPATTVAAGEDLPAVARRVYGTDRPDILDRLWHANRDQLPRRDSPLREGSLVRLP